MTTHAEQSTRPVPVDPGSPHFEGMVRLLEVVDRETVGDAAETQTLDYHLAAWRPPHLRRHAWVVLDDSGTVVGMARADLPLRDNTHLVELELAVRADHRHRGHGRALLAEVLRLARAEGREAVLSGTGHRPDPAEAWALHERAVADPSTTTRPPEHDVAGLTFALATGARLVQTEVRSQVRLPVPPEVLRAVEQEATARAGGYDVRTWRGLPPQDLLPGRAHLAELMSTDPPLGEVDWRPETWDEDRLREWYGDWQRRGLELVGAGAVERATGRLVAFSEMGRESRTPGIAYQFDTVVESGHRGHRLGMVVKAATLREVAGTWADVTRVQTWNALENGPMLRVNRALGFVPVGLYSIWQLDVTGA